MPTEYILYLPIVILESIIILSKAKNKAFIGLFLFWLFGSPIFLNPNYAISLSFFGIDIQPVRFLFLILTPVLFVSIISPTRFMSDDKIYEPTRLKPYELLLLGYILVVAFASVLNISTINSRKAIAETTNAIAFIVVYFCSKKFITKEDFALIKTALLTFAVISAIVAIYQFFIDPAFFRLGITRGAFSEYYRANGLFTAEYDQGLYLNLAVVVAISVDLKEWIKVILIALFCAGIFVTMHRLSWVALIITLGLIGFIYLRKNILTYTLVPLLVIITVIGALNVPWSQMAIGKFGYKLIINRILADTLSGRISQYKFSFYMIKEYPLGIGDYYTSFYNQEAVNQGIPLYRPYSESNTLQAYVVHNGFLSSGVKYGISGLVLYSLFILTSILFFFGNSIRNGISWYPLVLIMLIFFIFNLTNDFSYLGTQISMVLAWLLGGFTSVNDHNQIGNINS